MKRIIYKTLSSLSIVVFSLSIVLWGTCDISYAEDINEIPKQGVTYTLTYPDGTTVTENAEKKPLTYGDVIEALKEENWKLLGSDFTSDENGKVNLPTTWTKGTIRIVEKKVPAGYLQGNETEKTVDLKDGDTKFINPKKIPGEKYFTITYKMNGGEYKGSPDDILETYKSGTIIDIHEAPTRDGYTFDYWKGSEYQPGDKYEVTEDHTFVAQWKTKDGPATPLITNKKTGNPGTGDSTRITSWSMILLASILSLIILIQRKHSNILSADGSISMSKVGKMLFALLGVSLVVLVATSVYATGGFTINKVDDGGDPVEGAVFDVYGKPDITFETVPELIDISGIKTWDDNNDEKNERPTSITVRLHADGTEVEGKVLTVTKDDNWEYEFKNLPKNKNGVDIKYTVIEDVITDYTPTYSTIDYNIKNTYTPGKTSVTVEKAWEDGNNQDRIRPTEVTVKLLADEVDTGKTVTLNSANEWRGEFTDLDEKNAGVNIAYTVEEVKTTVITGKDGPGTYAVKITGSASTGYTITNTHTPQKYVLIYDPNGGTIDTAKNRDESNDTNASHTFSIRDNTSLGLSHSNPNRVFMGWADTDDADVPQYSVDGKGIKEGDNGTAVEIDNLAKNVTLTAPIKEKTIYAVWGTQYTLSFDPNQFLNGRGDVPKTQKAFSTKDQYSFRIPEQDKNNTPIRENEQKWNWKWWGLRYNATGPATAKNPHWLYNQPIILYADGDVENGRPEANQTLYAFYQPSNGAQVTFEGNTIDTVTNKPDDLGTSETNEIVRFNIGTEVPKRTNFVFIGWSTDPNRKASEFDASKDTDFNPGDKFEFNQIIEAYRTLYAVWKPYNQYRIHFVYNQETSKMYEDGVYRIVNGGFLHHYYGATEYGKFEVDGVMKDSQVMKKAEPTLDNEYTWTKAYWSNNGIHAKHVTTLTMKYDFLGWSTKPDGPVEYTVDDDGYINMDIKQKADEDSADGIQDLVLYAIWKETPLHTFRLLFMTTDTYNKYDNIVNRATGRAESFSDIESPLKSIKEDAKGNQIVVMPGSSQYANAGFIWKGAPLSETKYTISKEDLNTTGPLATKASTTTYDVKLIGWSYEPWKRSNPDIPVDENGYFLSDIVVEEPIVSPDECTGDTHNLLLWPVWKFTPKHTYSVFFSVDTGVNKADRLIFHNSTEDEMMTLSRMYKQYVYNDKTKKWSEHSSTGYWLRPLNSTVGGGYGNSRHSGDKFIRYYSDENPASVHNPPWDEAFWRSQRVYVEKNSNTVVRYDFKGWRRSDTEDVIPVDENGYLTKGITFEEDNDVLGRCEDKEEGTDHVVVLYPVWETVPLNTWRVVFVTNTTNGYNTGLNDEGEKIITSSVYGYKYEDSLYTEVVNKANNKATSFYTVNNGWAPTSVYSSGPHPINSEYGRQYTWTKDFWQAHCEAAERPNDENARYEFLGWSYGEKGNGYLTTKYPENLTEADVDIHVDSNGLINEDIVIKDPVMSTTDGHTFHKLLFGVWKTIPMHSYHLHFDKNFVGKNGYYWYVGTYFQEEEDGEWISRPTMHVSNYADFHVAQHDVEGSADHYTWPANGFWDRHGVYAVRPDNFSNDSEYYTYEFMGWSDAIDSAGNRKDPKTLTEADVDYHMTADGKHIAEDITIHDEDNCDGGAHHLYLYAVWKPIPRTRTYTLQYDVNGGAGTFEPVSKSEVYNEIAWNETSPNFDIDTGIPTKDEFTFAGWAQTKNATFGEFGYPHGDNAELRNLTRNLKSPIAFTFDDHKTGDLTAAKTLYAVWWYEFDIEFKENAYDAYGGPAVQHIYRSADHTIVRAFGEDNNDPLPTPVRPGYKFLGWSRDKDATVPEFSTLSEYPSDITIQGSPTGKISVTFYAIWEEE